MQLPWYVWLGISDGVTYQKAQAPRREHDVTSEKKVTTGLTVVQMKTLGREIKRCREGRNLSQGELGAAVSISGAAICRYEAGSRQPDATILFRMETVLNLAEYTLVKFLRPVG